MRKNGRYGFFNKQKSLGILIKREEDYVVQNDIIYGKCTVYVNKGTYFGGNTYAFSEIVSSVDDTIEIRTGKYVIYRGTTTSLVQIGVATSEDVVYLNVEEYLKKL